MENNFKGKCPCCGKNSKFRSLTFAEDLMIVAKISLSFFMGGKLKKAKNLALTIKDATDSRSFPNYICTNCHKKVMQCSRCHEILKYSDFNIDHDC